MRVFRNISGKLIAITMALFLVAGNVFLSPARAETPYRIGDVVLFGHYEQDGNTLNGDEPIEWIVCDICGDKTLLVSRYILDSQCYSENDGKGIWEISFIRKWLNDKFLNEAFTGSEQKYIVSAPEHSGNFELSHDDVIEDKVFLLSYAEAWTYFGNLRQRQTAPTKYAKNRKLSVNKGYSCWWLRTAGAFSSDAADVMSTGALKSHEASKKQGIRPAMWIQGSADLSLTGANVGIKTGTPGTVPWVSLPALYEMEWRETKESSTFFYIGYSKSTNTLGVIFYPDYTVGYYLDFPEEEWKNFSSAKSKGTYFNSSIKGIYEYSRGED